MPIRAAAEQAQQAPPPAPAAQPSSEQQDLTTLSQLVDGVSSGQQSPPGDVRVSWISNHFIRSQGETVYIPFTIEVDRAQLPNPSTAFYVRVMAKVPAGTSVIPIPGVRPAHPWDTIHPVEIPADGRVSRAIALPPGAYDAYVAVKERAPAGKIGLVKHELTVPALSGPDLTTSSVILARSVEQLKEALPAEKQQDNPYVFGVLRLMPALDGVFAQSGEMQVLFWIYNASHTAGKPDAVVDFSFHQRQPDGSFKYFNKTLPQELNQKTLPPDFDMTQGHQLLGSIRIQLKSFMPGDYRLDIKVTDKPGGKSVDRTTEFKVSAQ
jgi:hypothetical protein